MHSSDPFAQRFPRKEQIAWLVPDGLPLAEGLKRCTHIGIGSHQDDLEFMAFHGIQECYMDEEKWFGGITCTDGAGSPRTGPYAGCSDTEMRHIRRQEQDNAARVGRYGVMLQLGHSTATLKSGSTEPLISELAAILEAASPQIVYTHNPADKHDTHIVIFAAALEALRQLPAEKRPRAVYGCEVWRGLDWMLDDEKVLLDTGRRENLAAALNGLFDSQISGGKRYDLAVLGRRRANATFMEAHRADHSSMLTYAMDLTPLLTDPSADPVEWVASAIERFRDDVTKRLRRYLR
jgi:LmbE family N-acetylglucosaminyl deacetylase